MQPEFWYSRWQNNQIGFHQRAVNPYLQRFWPGLEVPVGARVLVPLCGKSLDLAWLAAQGYGVLGVELSQTAIEGFFEEQGLTPVIEQQGAFKRYRTHGLELWCGDVFALSPVDVADCVGVYDRAALIALPPEMRQRYAAHLAAILPRHCRGLLVTLDYDQAVVAGPPFAVAQDAVQALLARRWQLDLADDQDILGQSPKFQQASAHWLRERAYRLLPLGTL